MAAAISWLEADCSWAAEAMWVMASLTVMMSFRRLRICFWAFEARSAVEAVIVADSSESS